MNDSTHTPLMPLPAAAPGSEPPPAAPCSAQAAAGTPLQHPGPRHLHRRQAVPTGVTTGHTTLRPGVPLVDALSEVAAAAGVSGVQYELYGGTLDRISYCIPSVCTDGSAAMAYSSTREAQTPAQLLIASVTLGHRDGRRFMHCHAAWLDADGELHAGHLWPESITGAVPIRATTHLLGDAVLVSTLDPETRMPAFTPYSGCGPGREAEPRAVARGVISRLLPGQDLTGAVEDTCREHGLRRARVSASLGSLVGAGLQRRDGAPDVDGPGTEVVSVNGTAALGADGHVATSLYAVLVDRHGTVHAGPLVPGRNLVAVTFELLVVEDPS